MPRNITRSFDGPNNTQEPITRLALFSHLYEHQTTAAAPLSPYRWVMAIMFLVGRLTLGCNLFGIAPVLPLATSDYGIETLLCARACPGYQGKDAPLTLKSRQVV